MPKLIHKGKSIEVKQGEGLFPHFDELGIVYGCQSGNCGKCIAEVKSGMENLNAPQEAEEAFGLFDNERLLCQCVVEGNGDVEVHQE